MTPERWRLIDSRLGQPVGTDPDSTMTLPGAAAPTPGERCFPGNIGHYRVLRLVGEGGMGAVYEAEQEQPRRIVALKIIKPGLASPDLLRRFEQEAHALGRLQHPGIAQIYEAGTADTGLGAQPYFAMEFIRGPSLRDYGHQINTRQRLELMAKIADAVHHAHQRGLIHRDLKPGNILVDESGQPKILDFGVARVTDRDAQATRQTDLGQLVGTLAYMSPEQVLADPLEMDTRSDVYALGVILYELLAGRMPYNLSHKMHEALQAIREEEPARLSSINRHYRGDIETIVAKALEKDKARRYSSAAELAIDIRRHLNHEPIAAMPVSTVYQLQKLARRHRALVSGVAAVFLVLVAGIAASTWEAVRATRAQQAAISERNRAVTEKQRADTESATAKAINDFLQNDLLAQAGATRQAGPDTRPDRDLKVRTALDRAAARISGKFGRQPAVEASIRQTLGDSYQDLGLYAEAAQQLERAVDLRRQVLGKDSPDTLRSVARLADAYVDGGKYSSAEPLFMETLALQRRRLGEEHPDTLTTMEGLAEMYGRQGKYADAERLGAKALDGRTRVLGKEHPDTLVSLNYLATVYAKEGKYAQAEPLINNVVGLRRRVLGEENPQTMESMSNLAALYILQGKYAQAEPLVIKALELRRRVLGEEHPATLTTMNGLGELYRDEGKYAQAEPLFARTLAVRRRLFGEEHAETLDSLNDLAVLYTKQGKYAQAEDLFNKVLGLRRRVLGEEDPQTVQSTGNLAVLYAMQAKYAQAEPLVTRVLEIRRRTQGEEHPDTLVTMNTLGAVYRNEGKYVQAETLLTKVLDTRRRVLGAEHPDTLLSTYSLGNLYQRQSKYAEAEPLFIKAWEGRRRALGGQHPDTQLVLRELVQLYEKWGKPEQLAEWQEKLQSKQNPADTVKP
jgi:tetratricopeptide (TPR) repeat protein